MQAVKLSQRRSGHTSILVQIQKRHLQVKDPPSYKKEDGAGGWWWLLFEHSSCALLANGILDDGLFLCPFPRGAVLVGYSLSLHHPSVTLSALLAASQSSKTTLVDDVWGTAEHALVEHREVNGSETMENEGGSIDVTRAWGRDVERRRSVISG